MLASLIAVAFYVIAAIGIVLVLFPYTWITKNSLPIYRVGMWIGRMGLWLAGVRVTTSGEENIPARNCIFMSNHLSNLDPPVLFPLIPKHITLLFKKSLLKVPLLGRAMLMVGFLPIDRDSRSEAIDSLRIASEKLRNGESLAVFPEGTRSRDGRMLPFKKGAFHVAEELGVPIVPITLSGTEQMLRKGSKWLHPGCAHITYHPPIDPRAFAGREELMTAVRQSIASALPEHLRGDSGPEISMDRPALAVSAT